MDRTLVQDLRGRLAREDSDFWYFPGRYALMLLRRAVGGGASMRELKQSRAGGLLRKPEVRELLPLPADGWLEPEAVAAAWPPERSVHYRLGFGAWSGAQRSRPGQNLVVHLDFGHRHAAEYHRLFRGVEGCPFSYDCHPGARAPDHTLAWSRVDLDPDSGEALIEEIQNDWLREADDLAGYARRMPCFGPRRRARWYDSFLEDHGVEPRCVIHYVEQVLGVHRLVWAEAILAATLQVLWSLGMQRIYYHTWTGGTRMKDMCRCCAPPRSLYTTLPRRFCFRQVSRGPEFLYESCDEKRQEILEDPELRWLRLAI